MCVRARARACVLVVVAAAAVMRVGGEMSHCVRIPVAESLCVSCVFQSSKHTENYYVVSAMAYEPITTGLYG